MGETIRWWVDWDAGDSIRQGDVLRRVGADGLDAEWRLVVTADCDIVQRKAGDCLTLLTVVPALDYLREHWAPEQLRRLIARHTSPSLEAVNARFRSHDTDLASLTEDSLFRWLETHGAEAIIAATGPVKTANLKLVGQLRSLRIAAGHEGPRDPLDRLRAAWASLGRDSAQQTAVMREGLAGERGFPDFFLLPDLPLSDEFGHVVLLRDIGSVDAKEVFATELDGRLADRPDAFHRIARLHDGLRFAITQKLAFLFSRIGLPTTFEKACADATDLIIESACLGEIR